MSTSPLPTPRCKLSWYEVEDPASPQLDALGKKFNLHPLQVEDCRHRPQRAKYEEHTAYLFCVAKQIHDDAELVFSDVDIFIGKDFLITITQGHSELMDKVHKRITEDQCMRPDKALYFLVDSMVDEYSSVIDLIAEETSDLEDNVLTDPGPEKLQTIFRLKRKLIEFRRIASGMREVVNALMRREKGIVGDDLDPYFRDVYDHLVRIVDLIETYRDLLTGSLDIYLSAVANRTNNVMKVLTIWGTIALPLVIITGFFGMNFPIGLENSPYGIWVATGVMVLSTISVLIFFRRKGWY
ncbi:MAG: magnesium/cobalt transporter CorA [Candidatus Koribacter versatilis]|uniref:Magnesium transport protein CorA n=1 Tax=Candidatus Korobacter versatilis TaxID=658062 RepID=A0A932A8B2_9BACT|nr:magnesium/cobalt transporter CorA [Candidatus Koribacter versatilis]